MKSCFSRRHKRKISITTWCFVISILGVSALAQPSPKMKQSRVRAGEGKADAGRWRYLLDSLVVEARSLSPEKNRAYALAEVADAYWNLDREKARMLFAAALDAAVSLKEGEKANSGAVNYVLTKATGRDVTLTKSLLAKIAGTQKTTDAEETPLSIALELLKHDPGRAATLAQDLVPGGLSSGKANFFIFQLAKQDVESANQIYRAYLNKFAADPNLPLNQLISLGGYAFGYSEFYGLTRDMPPQLYGVSYRRIEKLSYNPALARAFLQLAFQSTQKTVEHASQMTGAERDYANVVNLFAIGYLLPEVVKYSPETMPAWEQLRQRAIVGTTTVQQEQAARHIASINERRAKIANFDNAPQLSKEQEAEANLERAEKLPGSCQKDREYSKAALSIGATKDFKRALFISDRISDFKQREGIKQVLFYDMALAASDLGEWTEVQEKAKSVSTPELTAILYIKTADTAVRRKDRAISSELLREAVKVAEKITDDQTRAGILFGVAAVQVRIDAFEGLEVLKGAIKSVNRTTTKDQSQLSILMKVSLDCQGDNEWYGGRVSLANASLYEALPLFSKYNAEETLLIAQNIEDPPTRVRVIASVVKYITAQSSL
jgi:hypothetical protein